MLQRCPGCGREYQYDVGLRSGVRLVICRDCAADGLTPEQVEAVHRVQCEGCGGMFPEDDLTFEAVPGATLGFCDGCTEPPLAAQYLGPGRW